MKTDSDNAQQTARTKRPEKIPSQRSNNTSGSVFDRLYNTSTASSKTRKVTGPVVNKCILGREKDVAGGKARRDNAKENASQTGKKQIAKKQVFNRLYEKGTAASSSKRIASERSAMKPKNQQS